MDKTTKRYLILGGVGILGVGGFVTYKKIRSAQQKAAAAKALKKGNVATLGINIPEIAKQIGIELGTAYPKYDPRSWTENDHAAQILVTKVPKPYIPVLISSYDKLYKRSLPDDLQKMLDNWNDVSYLFK